MPYKHNRTQHDALNVFDLYKAQDEELTFYRTSSRCIFHFGEKPAECLQTVLTSNDVVLRERRQAASWTSTTTTPEHTITQTQMLAVHVCVGKGPNNNSLRTWRRPFSNLAARTNYAGVWYDHKRTTSMLNMVQRNCTSHRVM